MDEKLKEKLSSIRNEYRGGYPLEVRAAREVVYHLTETKLQKELIPSADLVIYFGELYKAALEYLKDK